MGTLIKRALALDAQRDMQPLFGATTAIEDVKRMVFETSKKDREARQDLERKFAAAVLSQAASRNDCEPQPTQRTLALTNSSTALALVHREALDMARSTAEADRAEADKLRDDLRRYAETERNLH